MLHSMENADSVRGSLLVRNQELGEAQYKLGQNGVTMDCKRIGRAKDVYEDASTYLAIRVEAE